MSSTSAIEENCVIIHTCRHAITEKFSNIAEMILCGNLLLLQMIALGWDHLIFQRQRMHLSACHKSNKNCQQICIDNIFTNKGHISPKNFISFTKPLSVVIVDVFAIFYPDMAILLSYF